MAKYGQTEQCEWHGGEDMDILETTALCFCICEFVCFYSPAFKNIPYDGFFIDAAFLFY